MARTRNSGRVAKRNACFKILNKPQVKAEKNAEKKVIKKMVYVKKPRRLTYKSLVLGALKTLDGLSGIAKIQSVVHGCYPKMYLKDRLIRKSVLELFAAEKIVNSNAHKASFKLKPVAVAKKAKKVVRNRPQSRVNNSPTTPPRSRVNNPPSTGQVDGCSGNSAISNNQNTIATVISGAAVPPGCVVHMPYDIHLNLTDRSRNMDKFMKMQIVKNGDQFWFINNWGRNGTSGQFQVKKFDDRVDAEKAMEAKFKTKTGRSWAKRNETNSSDSNARGGRGHYELVQRLKAAGASFSTKKGSVAISLMWDHNSPQKRNDLDLWVTSPSGEKIGYSNKRSACGGELDVDRMQGAPEPVENIVWTGDAPVGEYKVQVNNYSANHNTSMPFKVSIVTNGGKREMYDMVMPGTPKHWVDVKTFCFK